MVFKFKRRFKRKNRRTRKAPFRYRQSKPSILNYRKVGHLTVFQRWTDILTIPADATASDFFSRSYDFALLDIDNAQITAWARVFKQYRLKHVKIEWMPVYTNVAAAGDTVLSTVYSCTDIGPKTLIAWADENAALLTEGTKIKRLFGRYNSAKGSVHTHTLNPRLQTTIVTDGPAIAGLAPTSTWIDFDNQNARYQGMQFGMQFDESHPELRYKVLYTFVIECRGVR